MPTIYVSRKRDYRDVYEVIAGDGVLAEIRILVDGYQVLPTPGRPMIAEIDKLAEQFIGEWLTNRAAIDSVVGWSPEYRECARKLAHRSTAEEPAAVPKPATRERKGKRLTFAYGR